MFKKGFYVLCLSLSSAVLFAQEINKDAFYAAFSSDEVGKLDAEIEAVKKSGSANKQAFEGALTMKKAAFAKGNSKKLSLFKAGHKLLEEAISTHSNDVELRLLRLMIQENAPKMLKYNKEIAADSLLIKEHYKELPPQLQQVIVGYSKKSKVLNPSQF